jgi:hypothetical protein
MTIRTFEYIYLLPNLLFGEAFGMGSWAGWNTWQSVRESKIKGIVSSERY